MANYSISININEADVERYVDERQKINNRIFGENPATFKMTDLELFEDECHKLANNLFGKDLNAIISKVLSEREMRKAN